MSAATGAGADVDVLVVGGGPVGLGAAIEARLAGYAVAVLERRPGAPDKACGEGLMPPGVSALRRLGVDPDGLGGTPFTGIRYLATRPGGDVSATARFRAGPGLGVRRTALVGALAARADALGVLRVTGRPGPDDLRRDASQPCGPRPDGVGPVDPRPEGGAVEVAGIRASWVLAADGLHSPIRRRLGLDVPVTGPAARRYGLRRHHAVRPWTDLVEVHWAPDAEAYVTPVGPDLVGLAVLGPAGLTPDTWWRRFPRLADRLAAAPVVTPLLGAGPLRQRARRRVHGRVLLVGDAAGYLDALTGEGISLGLACARAAVDCLAAGRPQEYEAAWWRVTRRYRLLTGSLLAVAARPRLRRGIVPLAAGVPAVFSAVVDGLG